MAPNLAAAADGGAWLTWLEPRPEGGHRLRVARFTDGAWGEAATIAAGDDFFANWADVPSLAAGAAGELLAQWPAKLGAATYAYGVHLARSTDGGASWQPAGLLHADRSPTEHGFTTLLAAPGGGFDALWLDGREMGRGGPMGLRHARVSDGLPGAETVLDDRVCDCCQTAAVRAGGALVVAYRDRTEGEVRDVSVLRHDGGWSRPAPLHADGWTIPGCPVNGPALAADGERTAVAWFTAAGGRPRVLAAFSRGNGAGFTSPRVIDAGKPLGRVGIAPALAPAADGAVVSWLAADGVVRLRHVGAGGGLGTPYAVGRTTTSRAAGVPRLLAADGRYYVAWVETVRSDGGDERPRAVRFAAVPAAALAPAGS